MRKRKVISIVTAVAILIVTSCVTSNAATKYKVGDVNKDGVISINDVTLIQLYLSNDLRTIDLSVPFSSVLWEWRASLSFPILVCFPSDSAGVFPLPENG